MNIKEKNLETIIVEDVGFSDQSVVFHRIFSIKNTKLKIEIKSDAYDCQSYAKISVFSAVQAQWNLLDNIHYSLMATRHKLYINPKATLADFECDAKKLTDIAKDILF